MLFVICCLISARMLSLCFSYCGLSVPAVHCACVRVVNVGSRRDVLSPARAGWCVDVVMVVKRPLCVRKSWNSGGVLNKSMLKSPWRWRCVVGAVVKIVSMSF